MKRKLDFTPTPRFLAHSIFLKNKKVRSVSRYASNETRWNNKIKYQLCNENDAYRGTRTNFLNSKRTRLIGMPLTLCTLFLVCSMCSFLYATFYNHQPTITNYHQLPLSTIRNKKKSKLPELNKFCVTIETSFIGLFERSVEWKSITGQILDLYVYYTSPPLFMSSLRPHWRCSHIVGYFCPFTYVHAHHR